MGIVKDKALMASQVIAGTHGLVLNNSSKKLYAYVSDECHWRVTDLHTLTESRIDAYTFSTHFTIIPRHKEFIEIFGLVLTGRPVTDSQLSRASCLLVPFVQEETTFSNLKHLQEIYK